MNLLTDHEAGLITGFLFGLSCGIILGYYVL